MSEGGLVPGELIVNVLVSKTMTRPAKPLLVKGLVIMAGMLMPGFAVDEDAKDVIL
jgi:hypothetical protein